MQSAELISTAQTTSASQALGTPYVAVIYQKQTFQPNNQCCDMAVSKTQDVTFLFCPLQNADHDPILTSPAKVEDEHNSLCLSENISFFYNDGSQTTCCTISTQQTELDLAKPLGAKKRGRKPNKRSKYEVDPNANPNLPMPSHSIDLLIRTRHPVEADYEKALFKYAKRLGVSIEEVKEQLKPNANLSLQQLFAWSHVLDEPFASFLPIHSDFAENLIQTRGFCLRVLKTVKQLPLCKGHEQLMLVTKSILDMFHEFCPEFDDVKPWPSIGQSRAAKGYGAIVDKVDSNFSRLCER
ncbi:MAG: hypothetical protein Q4G03_00665 [Planctomycetia bacterium]|nr:hypothetical protein [Planctomycetia bacterium]